MTAQEEAKQTVLDMKIACIIETFSKEYNVPLHCRSDKYLADEHWLELQEKA